MMRKRSMRTLRRAWQWISSSAVVVLLLLGVMWLTRRQPGSDNPPEPAASDRPDSTAASPPAMLPELAIEDIIELRSIVGSPLDEAEGFTTMPVKQTAGETPPPGPSDREVIQQALHRAGRESAGDSPPPGR